MLVVEDSYNQYLRMLSHEYKYPTEGSEKFKKNITFNKNRYKTGKEILNAKD